jgi:hypothetical protein
MGEEKKGGRLDEPTPPCISEPHDHLSVEKIPCAKQKCEEKSPEPREKRMRN